MVPAPTATLSPAALGRVRPPTTIELCGALSVRIRGRAVTDLPGRQGRLLFAYLVLNRERPVGRDELIDVLWPSNPPATPEAAFASVLARVRSAVGRDVIVGRAELSLCLDADAHVDVETARAHLSDARDALGAGDPAAAWDLAGAGQHIVSRPLLAGLGGSWVDTARAGLADLDSQLLEVMGEAALRLDSVDGAAVGHTLVERHPFRESGYALLMRLQARRGDVAEAVTTFHRLRTLLLDELGTAPSPSVVALHDRLLRHGSADGPDAPAGAPVPLPVIGTAEHPFIGREPALGRLRHAWRASLDGQRRLALLTGDAGAGKTRTARQFAAEAYAAGATVLYGRCDEEPIRSYQAFAEALRHYLRHGDWQAQPAARRDLRELARMLPEASAESDALPDPESERHRLFEAVVALLDRVAAARPLLLVLDDLQWADRATLLLLRHLLRAQAQAPVFVLASYRHTEVDDDHALRELIAGLHRERRFDRIELAGLDERETEALVASRLAEASPRFVSELRRLTDGNPFFIGEMLRSHQDGRDPGALRSGAVPAAVADVIVRGLARLSSFTREALTVGAVAGREFEIGPVKQVLEVPDDAVVAAVEEAMARGLLVEVHGHVDRFAFCHGLVRDAIYRRISASRRLRLHHRLGLALEAGAGLEPPGAAELAHHFFLARALVPSGEVVRHAMRAGDEASAACAYEDAIAHYRRAAAALDARDPDVEPRRCEILLALGRAQWQAGEAGARDTYMRVAAGARGRGESSQLARAALGLGERYWEAGLVDAEHGRLLAEALDGLEERDTTVRARLMARLGENLHFAEAQPGGEELSAAAVAMARRLGDPPTLLKALLGRHVALLHTEYLPERRRLIDEALELTREHHGLSAEVQHWRVYDLCESGEMDAARKAHAELTTLSARLGQPLLEYVAASWQGVFAHLAGHIEQSERLARVAFELGTRAQVEHAASSYVAKLVTTRRQQGRLGELLPMIRTIVAQTRIPAWEAALALAEIETGDRAGGRERYERLAAEGLPRDWYWLPGVALLAEACRALDDTEGAAALYEQLRGFADRTVQLSLLVCWGSLERHLGLLATVLGRPQAAADHFDAALERDHRSGAVLMEAETSCAYGELLLLRGGPGDSRHAAALGAGAERVAAARRLEALHRRAAELRHSG